MVESYRIRIFRVTINTNSTRREELLYHHRLPHSYILERACLPQLLPSYQLFGSNAPCPMSLSVDLCATFSSSTFIVISKLDIEILTAILHLVL